MIEISSWRAVFEKLGIQVEDLHPPEDVEALLKSPCPIWPDKLFGQTHIIVPLVEGLGHLKQFGALVEKYNEKQPSDRDWISLNSLLDIDPLDRGISCERYGKTRWVALSRFGLPKSEGKPFQKQVEMVERLREESGINYELAALKDAYTALTLYSAVSGERLYQVGKFYVRETEEKIVPKLCCWHQRVDSPMVLGPFGRGGLVVANVADLSLYADCASMAVIRKLR